MIITRVEHELHKQSVNQSEAAHNDGHQGEEEHPMYITMNSDSISDMVSKIADGTTNTFIEAEGTEFLQRLAATIRRGHPNRPKTIRPKAERKGVGI